MRKTRTVVIALITCLLVILPYLIAVKAAGSGYVFGGFLLNPIDGNSYFAKMVEGWRGAWTFTLPYTAEVGSGSYLFLFYIFLGHIARWTGLSIPVVFHLARIIATIVMIVSLDSFVRYTVKDRRISTFCLLFVTLGSGLGWIAYLFFQVLTPDFWVAEAYPFLSAYVNPHFPLSIAILLWLFRLASIHVSWKTAIAMALGSLALAILLPFGIVLLGLVTGILAVWNLLSKERVDWLNLILLGAGGYPMLLYQYWLTKSDPLLAVWNSQNQTPAPPVLQLILALSPALPLAVVGAIAAWRKQTPGLRLVLAWGVSALALLYVPFNLQRRFMLGLYIPLGILAVAGIAHLSRGQIQRQRLIQTITLILSLPTAILILLAGYHGVQTHDLELYLTRGEFAALQWIDTNTPENATILASPETGLLIPAYTGRRVFYGHPFETVDAKNNEQLVTQFFTGGIHAKEILTNNAHQKINYVFWGPREKALGTPIELSGLQSVYQENDVTIFVLQAD